MLTSHTQRKLSALRKKLWKEAGPPPDLATRLFSERIVFLVRPLCVCVCGGGRHCPDANGRGAEGDNGNDTQRATARTRNGQSSNV
jgi:hypothetical protein